jgi:hypothetical protein
VAPVHDRVDNIGSNAAVPIAFRNSLLFISPSFAKLYRDNCGRRRTMPAVAMTAAKANTIAMSGAISENVA